MTDEVPGGEALEDNRRMSIGWKGRSLGDDLFSEGNSVTFCSSPSSFELRDPLPVTNFDSACSVRSAPFSVQRRVHVRQESPRGNGAGRWTAVMWHRFNKSGL